MEVQEKIEVAQAKIDIQIMVSSNYVSRYKQNLCTSEPQMLKIKINLIQKLHEKGMINQKGSDDFKLSLIIVESSPIFQYIVVKVFYGRFQLILSILFSDDRSPIHQIFTRFGGNFSTVYKASILKREAAIKCTHYNKENFVEVFGDVVKEYIIFKVLQELKLGPKVEKYLGFDIIIGFNCIQFCTEFCQHQLQASSLPTVSKDLKQILLKLHSLNIIHGDIKTDNICYSNAHNKFVFIDFGLHCISAQPLGKKSWTSFKGTVGYVLPQMEECLSIQKQQFIDLYYNDLYGLQKIFNEIQKNNNISHRGNHTLSADITKIIAQSLMKGAIVEKYLISQFAVEEDYYKKLNKYFSQNFEFNQGEINQFYKIFSNRSKLGFSTRQLFEEFPSIEEAGLNEKEEALFFNYFKKQNCLIAVDKIKQIQSTFPLDRGLLVQDGQCNMKEMYSLTKQQFTIKLDDYNYLQLVSKYISKFQDRQQFYVCKFMLESRLKINCSDLLEYQVLGRAYTYLINYSLGNKLSTHRFFYIFKKSMVSAIIIEIFSEKQLKSMMESSLNLEVNLVRKCRIFLVFLEGLQWVKLRLQSRYNIKTLLNFLFQKLHLLLDSCNETNFRKQELNLIKCMKMLLTPSLEPSKLIQILKAIHNHLHFYYFSTNECQSALVEVLMMLTVASEIQGEKQFMISKDGRILSRIKQMKIFELTNSYSGSDILFAKTGEYFESQEKGEVMKEFLSKRRFIKYYSMRKGQQKFTTTLFDFIKNSVLNEARRRYNPTRQQNKFQTKQNIYDPKPSGLSLSEQSFSKKNLIEFSSQIEDPQVESQQYNYSKIKQQIITGYSSYKFYELLSYFYDLAKNTQYYHKHELPLNIQAIMSIISFHQQKDHQQILDFQYSSILEEILNIINSTTCLVCKFFSSSFFNIKRYFIKPKPLLTFAQFQQYLIQAILNMTKLAPFTQLFAKFLFEVSQMIYKINQQLSENFNYQFGLLFYEICIAINSFQLFFTVNRGIFDTPLLKQLLKYFWESNRREDYCFIIKKVHEYVQKSNSRRAKKYFVDQILLYRSEFIFKEQVLTFELTEENNYECSAEFKQKIQFDKFCQEHIDEFMKKAYSQRKSLGIYTTIMASNPFNPLERNNNYLVFSWLNYRQLKGYYQGTSWKIYSQYIKKNQKQIPKRKMRFLEKRKIFIVLGLNFGQIQYKQEYKLIQLRVGKMIGNNHLAHCQRNKQKVKKIKNMQLEQIPPVKSQIRRLSHNLKSDQKQKYFFCTLFIDNFI